MRPATSNTGGTPKDTMILRTKSDYTRIAVYVVVDGNRVLPIAVPDGTMVELVVTG